MDGLVIDLADLPRQVGSYKDVHLEVPAPQGLGTSVIGVQPGTLLLVDATLTSTDDGVLVRATAQAHLRGECVRCLKKIAEDRHLSFDDLYLLPEAAQRYQQEDEDPEAEEDPVFVLSGTSLDLEPALRDAVVGSLPFRPLCVPDCPGLCQDCGERLADLPADHHHEALDPRWAVLGGLLQEDPAGGAPGTQAADESKEQH